MKQLKNGYADYYYITESGEIYNKEKDIYIKPDRDYKLRLRKEDNSIKRITLKKIYKMVYDKPFCIDKIENLEGEQWHEIERTDHTYFISNLGRVKSYCGYIAKILKPTITKNGYARLDIVQEGQRSSKFVHRLVAAAFLPKPESIDIQIHHKDFNKLNNRAENLQYCTMQQHLKLHKEGEQDNVNILN